MNTNHTPGPWHVVDGGKHWNNPAIPNYRIHAPSGGNVFDVAWSEHGELVVEHVYEAADAHLIAAAPELLDSLDPDTLDAIASEIDCFEHSARAASLRALAKRQRAAIAKATGAQA